MLQNYISLNRLFRTIINKLTESEQRSDSSYEPDLRFHIQTILDDLDELKRLWPKGLDKSQIDSVYSEISPYAGDPFGPPMYEHISSLTMIMKQLEDYFSRQDQDANSIDILDLLHPIIIRNAYQHFNQGHYREAVLNALVAVFDFIRQRTKLDLDGLPLAQKVFSERSPLLIISTMKTESGRSEQIGFMKLLEGAYSSIRNPKAHSLLDNPSKLVAAQNLIFASLLAGRIEESKTPLEDQP